MLKLIILFVFLIILLLISGLTSKGSILNPQFLFISGFALSVGYAFFYIREMRLELADMTFFVLFFGIFIYFIVSVVGQKLGELRDKKIVERDCDRYSVEASCRINVDFWKMLIFLAVNCMAAVLFLRFIKSLSPNSSLREAIFNFDHIRKFTNAEIDVPGLVSILRMASSAILYICIYLLAHQLVHGYKQNRMTLYMNIVLSCVNAIFSGGRAVIIGYIFAFILMAYFIYKAKYNWKKKVPAKIILFLFFAALMIVPVFYISAFLMGRGKQTDIFHYMCIYLSGEIKNLDVFVRRGIFGTDISNSQTLVSLRRTVLPSFGITGWNSKLELPFINVNGFSTGNVYTIFYMFLYDGGFAALVFYTVLMALLMSLSFRYVINERFRKYYSTINIPLIIYAQLSYAILFSFFSDKFYELIFDLAIWRKNLIILLFVWFITRFKLPASDERAVIIRTRKYVFRKSIYVLRDNKNAS